MDNSCGRQKNPLSASNDLRVVMGTAAVPVELVSDNGLPYLHSIIMAGFL